MCPVVLCNQYPLRDGDGAARSGVRPRPVRGDVVLLVDVLVVGASLLRVVLVGVLVVAL